MRVRAARWNVLAAVICAAGVGCGELLGADEYVVAEPRADGALPDTGTVMPSTYGWVPGIPDEGFVDECAECAKDACRDERNLCLDPRHPDCWERLVCASLCDDPDCMQACESAQFVAGLTCEGGCAAGDALCTAGCWEGRHRFTKLQQCLLGDADDADKADAACGDACNAGLNYGCVEQYEWQPSEGPVTVRVELREIFWSTTALNVYQGLEVSYGDVNFRNTPPIEGTSDVRGIVDLVAGGPGRSAFEFTVVSPYDVFPIRAVALRSTPLVRPLQNTLHIPGARNNPPLTGATVGGMTFDCLGSRGMDLWIELETEAATHVAEVLNLAILGNWERNTATGATNWFKITGLPDLSDHTVRLVARRHDASGVVISSTMVFAYTGWTTYVELHPAAAPY